MERTTSPCSVSPDTAQRVKAPIGAVGGNGDLQSSLTVLSRPPRNTPMWPGFKVVFYDHDLTPVPDGRPEWAVGRVTFHREAFDGSTRFTAASIAATIWNTARVLADAGFMPCGTCWALAKEDEPDPINCASGDWPTPAYKALDDAWNDLLEAKVREDGTMDTSLILDPM